METQGQPIGGSAGGAKNTSDSDRYTNPTVEAPGAVASDSLAAESAKAGGAFSENRGGGEVLGVSGASSTLANTDTSAASTLPPAFNATKRDQAWNESGAGEKYPEAAGGQPEFPGSHAGGTYSGGPTSAKQATAATGAFQGAGDQYSTGPVGSGAGDSGSTTGAGLASNSSGSTFSQAASSTGTTSSTGTGTTGGSSNVDKAPGYIADVTQPFNTSGPKGKNLTETDDLGGQATYNAEIGSEFDPGRVAEQTYQKQSQSVAGSTAARQGQEAPSTGAYDALQNN